MSAYLSVLTQQVKAICPIYGISIGDKTDKSTWRIDFDPAATDAQKSAAKTVVQNFDVAAEEATEAAQAQIDVDLGLQAKADAVIAQLQSASITQIQNYVQNNVTDLASAKAFLVKLAVAVAYSLRN